MILAKIHWFQGIVLQACWGRHEMLYRRSKLILIGIALTLSLRLFSVSSASAQSSNLMQIPSPLPFPKGNSIFQWDYECISLPCGLTGFWFGHSADTISIVLADIQAGPTQIPTYFYWIRRGSGFTVNGFIMYPNSINFINMRLISAGNPGL